MSAAAALRERLEAMKQKKAKEASAAVSNKEGDEKGSSAAAPVDATKPDLSSPKTSATSCQPPREGNGGEPATGKPQEEKDREKVNPTPAAPVVEEDDGKVAMDLEQHTDAKPDWFKRPVSATAEAERRSSRHVARAFLLPASQKAGTGGTVPSAKTAVDVVVGQKRARDCDSAVSAVLPDGAPKWGVEEGEATSRISLLRSCRPATRYERGPRISEGVYGVVYKGKDRTTGELRALKWIKDEWFKDSAVGFPEYLLRELDLVMRVKHPNIVSGIEIVTHYVSSSTKEAVARSQAPPASATNTTTAAAPPPNVPTALAAPKVAAPTLPTATTTAAATTSTSLPPTPTTPSTTINRPKLFFVSEYAGHNLRSEIYRGYQPQQQQQQQQQSNNDTTTPSASSGTGAAGGPLPLPDIKFLFVQLLEGLHFLHSRQILHRDLKPSNVLVNDDCVVKICDLGLSRIFKPYHPDTQKKRESGRPSILTTCVVTLMYRAPELHLNFQEYNSSIDMWAAGCILAEMLLQTSLFPADDDLQHLAKVVEVLGAPTPDTFPGVHLMPDAIGRFSGLRVTEDALNNVVPVDAEKSNGSKSRLRWTLESLWLKRMATSDNTTTTIPADVGQAFDLVEQLVQWNPKNRLTAAEALRHPLFSTNHSLSPPPNCDTLKHRREVDMERRKREADERKRLQNITSPQSVSRRNPSEQIGGDAPDTKGVDADEGDKQEDNNRMSTTVIALGEDDPATTNGNGDDDDDDDEIEELQDAGGGFVQRNLARGGELGGMAAVGGMQGGPSGGHAMQQFIMADEEDENGVDDDDAQGKDNMPEQGDGR